MRKTWISVLAGLGFLFAPAFSQTAQPPSDTLSRVAEAEGELAQIRQLPFQKSVGTRLLPPDEVLKIIAGELDRETPTQELALRGTALSHLRLLPPGFPIRERLLALLKEQVAGLYLPREGSLVVVDLPPEMRGKFQQSGIDFFPVVLAHELDHALTDQHFGLESLIEDPELKGRDDMQMARQSLAEGDAMLAMLLLAFQKMGMKPTPETIPDPAMLRGAVQQFLSQTDFKELGETPPYLRAQLMEPYLLGLEYVLRAFKKGGWTAVDALWKHPPASTEQLLHPERSEDPPQTIEIDRLPGGWRRVFTMELGEFGIRSWLATKLADPDASQAAAGWGGDQLLLLFKDRQESTGAAPAASSAKPTAPESAIMLFSVWDDSAEAAEFAAAAERWLWATSGPQDNWFINQRAEEVRVFLQPFPAPPEPRTPVVPLGKDPWEQPQHTLENAEPQ